MSFFDTLFGGTGGSVPAGPSKDQTAGATSGLSSAGSTAGDFLKNYGTTGAGGLNSGLNNLSPVANWFQTIMNGNKQATLNQLQPQIQQIQQGQNTALQTANTLAPRGGGRSATLFDQPFEAQKQIAGQYAGARAGAPGGLQAAGTAQGALGSAAAGAGSQFGNVANTSNNNLLNYGLNQQQQANQQATSAGGLFGKLIGPLLNFIPGVGPLLSAGIGAAGSLFKGSNDGSNRMGGGTGGGGFGGGSSYG